MSGDSTVSVSRSQRDVAEPLSKSGPYHSVSSGFERGAVGNTPTETAPGCFAWQVRAERLPRREQTVFGCERDAEIAVVEVRAEHYHLTTFQKGLIAGARWSRMPGP